MTFHSGFVNIKIIRMLNIMEIRQYSVHTICDLENGNAQDRQTTVYPGFSFP